MEESERESAVGSDLTSDRCEQTERVNTCPGGKDRSDVDKKLDISSDQFDPLLALYSPEVPLPFPNIKCFNNLAEYESFMRGGRGRAKPENVEKRIRKARRGVADPERIERLKQLMVKVPCEPGDEVKRPAVEKRKAPKNVLTRMPLHQGSPLGELNRCVQQRLRVRVHIRSFKGLRGVCSGFVVAFDKFWNLAMVDVDETYREPLLGEALYHEKALTVTRLFEKLEVQAGKKTEGAETSKAESHPHSTGTIRGQTGDTLAVCVNTRSAAGLKRTHKVSKAKAEYGRVRTRHVNQLFIRGENVLLVHIQ